MNLVLAGGGMKVSYQIGQAAALVERFGAPQKVYAVSSGLITASIIVAHGSSANAMLAAYRSYLSDITRDGKLPALRACRRLAAEMCGQMLRSTRSYHVQQAQVFGVQRDSFVQTRFDLLAEPTPPLLQALMSIPTLLDSQESRRLGIIDGGYHQNIPWEVAHDQECSIVLSYFTASSRHPRSFDEFAQQLKFRPSALRRALRHLWAWINSTYPHHPAERHNLIWCDATDNLRLDFFSRPLSAHLQAIEDGYLDFNTRFSACLKYGVHASTHLLAREAGVCSGKAPQIQGNIR